MTWIYTISTSFSFLSIFYRIHVRHLTSHRPKEEKKKRKWFKNSRWVPNGSKFCAVVFFFLVHRPLHISILRLVSSRMDILILTARKGNVKMATGKCVIRWRRASFGNMCEFAMRQIKREFSTHTKKMPPINRTIQTIFYSIGSHLMWKNTFFYLTNVKFCRLIIMIHEATISNFRANFGPKKEI